MEHSDSGFDMPIQLLLKRRYLDPEIAYISAWRGSTFTDEIGLLIKPVSF